MVKAANIKFGLDTPAEDPIRIERRDFQRLGDAKYAITYQPVGIYFEIDRMRRERHELNGELLVSVPRSVFDGAKGSNGVISVGDLNLSSVQARKTRAAILAERAGPGAVDWFGLLEEFCLEVLEAERRGPTPVDLKGVPIDDEQAERGESWDVLGLPILQKHPMILFGDGGSAKSYLAIYVAGTLAGQGVRVLYADWEFDMSAHRARFRRLFRPEPEGLMYLRCERPMREEAGKIAKVIKEHKIGYVVCDSVGYATEGRPEEAERANEYFRAVRGLGIGSLHLAHVTKNQDTDQKPDGPIGSIFWRNGARSVWYIQAAKENPNGTLSVGLYHRKNNLGRLLAPRGYTLTFADGLTRIQEANVADIDELAAGLPILERLRKHLLTQSLNIKDISEELNVSAGTVRATISRHKSSFVKVGNKWGVKDDRNLAF